MATLCLRLASLVSVEVSKLSFAVAYDRAFSLASRSPHVFAGRLSGASGYNATRCNANSTCCAYKWSPNGYGVKGLKRKDEALHISPHTHTNTHKHKHKQTHTQTHTNTHTKTNTLFPPFLFSLSLHLSSVSLSHLSLSPLSLSPLSCLNRYGCCTMPNAVCCSNGYTCCPEGTTCQDTGTSWDVVTTCVDKASGLSLLFFCNSFFPSPRAHFPLRPSVQTLPLTHLL